MTNDAVHSALVRWMAGVTGKTTIHACQGIKAPDLPYIVINLTGVSEVREHPQEIEYDGDEAVIATPIIETEWRFSSQSFGPSPTDILRPVVSAQKLAQITEPLMPGLIIHDLSQIRNVPDFINNAWEPRAQMDIFVRGLVKDGHVIDVIEETTFVHERV